MTSDDHQPRSQPIDRPSDLLSNENIDLASDLIEFRPMELLPNAVQHVHDAMLVSRTESGNQHKRKRNKELWVLLGQAHAEHNPNK